MLQSIMGYGYPPLWTDRLMDGQTRVKTLPSLVLRTRAVKRSDLVFEITDSKSRDFLQVSDTFKGAKRVAYIGALILTLILIIVWPASATAMGVFSYGQFKHWVRILLQSLKNKTLFLKLISHLLRLFFS